MFHRRTSLEPLEYRRLLSCDTPAPCFEAFYTIDQSRGLPTGIDTADMDADGDVDIVASYPNRKQIVWWENVGVGFQPHVVGRHFFGLDSIATADMNGDELTDIVATLDLGVAVLTQQSDGSFEQSWFAKSSGPARLQGPIVVLDVGGDGDVDILRASESVELFENVGDDEFVYSQLPWDHQGFRRLRVADLNGDGLEDLLIGRGWHRNTSDGLVYGFDIVENSSDFWPADFDRDGDIDLVGTNGWYANKTDSFDDSNATAFATLDLPMSSRRAKPIADDINNDGFPDLIAVRGNAIQLYLADTVGGLVSEPSTFLLPDWSIIRAIDLIEMNSEGLQGLVVAGDAGLGWLSPERLIIGGNEEPLPQQPPREVTLGEAVVIDEAYVSPVKWRPGKRFALGDVDVDGDLDIIFPANGGIAAAENVDGLGRWNPELRILRGDTLVYDIVAADLDLDGDDDILFSQNPCRFCPREVYWIANQADGTYSDAQPIGEGTLIQVADIDDDADLDVVAHSSSRIWVHRNDGMRFTSSDVGASSISTLERDMLQLFDIDGDGTLEIGWNYTHYPSWYDIVDGQVVDNRERITIQYGTQVRSMAGGDLDGDGGPADIIYGQRASETTFGAASLIASPFGGPEEFIRIASQGTMNFTPSVSFNVQIDLADLDSDGDLDLLIRTVTGTVVVEYLGDQQFAAPVLMNTERDGVFNAYVKQEVGDIDGDGDLDVVIARRQGTAAADRFYWYENLGQFEFARHAPIGLGSSGSWAGFSLVDDDRDGDLDLVRVAGDRRLSYENLGAGRFAARRDDKLVPTGDIWPTRRPPHLALIDDDGIPDYYVNSGVLLRGIDAEGRQFEYAPQSHRAEVGEYLYLDTDYDGDFDQQRGKSNWIRMDSFHDLDGDGDLDGITYEEGRTTLHFQSELATFETRIIDGRWLPGDLNHDGTIDLVGAAGWMPNNGEGQFGEQSMFSTPVDGTLLDVGDIDGDGQVDLLVEADQDVRWYPLIGRTPGDLTGDLIVDDQDIDLLAEVVANQTHLPEFDLTGDSIVNAEDSRFLVENTLETRTGDANLDGNVDFLDFLVFSQNFGNDLADWSHGDFDGDGTVSFDDFLMLTENFGFRRTTAGAP